MKKNEIIKNIITATLLVIMLPVVIVNIVILIKSYKYPDKIPDFLGYKPFIVLSGSMETEISTGDLVIVKQVDVSSLKTGEIIAFKESNVVITHRIIDVINEEGLYSFKTKGDNNDAEDNFIVKADKVEGKFVKKYAKLGNIAMYIQSPTGFIVAVSIPIALIVIMQFINTKKYEKELDRYRKEQKNKK